MASSAGHRCNFVASLLKLRWWRDRARPIVMSGLAIYAIGFFLDWPFEFAVSSLVKWLGACAMAWGAGCGLLWYVDASQGESSRDADGADDES